jgi:hypothetical protein
LIISTLSHVGSVIFHVRGGDIAGFKTVSNSIRKDKISMNFVSVSSHRDEYEELILLVLGGDLPKISRVCQMTMLLLFVQTLSSMDVLIFP